MKKVRVGLVGLGPLGKVHAENLMYRIPNAQLTAVCTRTQSKLDAVRRDWETPETYTDFAEMLDKAQLDLCGDSMHRMQMRSVGLKQERLAHRSFSVVTA